MPVAVESMTAGKHVLVEKPMAKTLEEAQKMIDTARATGKILMVGQSRRFFDAVRISREMLDNIGRPFSVLYHWGSSFNESSAPPWWRSSEATGGLILPMSGSHAVDQILWYYGRKPKTVYAKIYNSKTYWEGASEASIIMEYGENEIATLKLSLATKPVLHQVVINGPKGTLVINHQEEKNVVGVGYLELMHDGEIVHKGLQRPTNFYYQAREFGSAIIENRQPIASGFEVIENMKVLNAILASAESNLPVAVED
jgi:predicted dehydrogenase